MYIDHLILDMINQTLLYNFDKDLIEILSMPEREQESYIEDMYCDILEAQDHYFSFELDLCIEYATVIEYIRTFR